MKNKHFSQHIFNFQTNVKLKENIITLTRNSLTFKKMPWIYDMNVTQNSGDVEKKRSEEDLRKMEDEGGVMGKENQWGIEV